MGKFCRGFRNQFGINCFGAAVLPWMAEGAGAQGGDIRAEQSSRGPTSSLKRASYRTSAAIATSKALITASAAIPTASIRVSGE